MKRNEGFEYIKAELGYTQVEEQDSFKSDLRVGGFEKLQLIHKCNIHFGATASNDNIETVGDLLDQLEKTAGA